MTPAELAMVVPGCAVFDAEPDQDPELPIRGGIVYAIERKVDADTGELTDVYRTCEPYQGRVRWASLDAGRIRQWSPPNPSSVRYLIRHLAKQVAVGKGALDSDDLRHLDVALILTRNL